jgi:hypothetical protein
VEAFKSGVTVLDQALVERCNDWAYASMHGKLTPLREEPQYDGNPSYNPDEPPPYEPGEVPPEDDLPF